MSVGDRPTPSGRAPVVGGHLAAFRSGTATPIILCHGGPRLWDYPRSIAELTEEASEVVRFDQRRCGLSRSGAPYTLDRAGEDIEAIRALFGLDAPVGLG